MSGTATQASYGLLHTGCSTGLIHGSPDMTFILPLEIQLYYPLHHHVNIRVGKKASTITASSILAVLGQPRLCSPRDAGMKRAEYSRKCSGFLVRGTRLIGSPRVLKSDR